MANDPKTQAAVDKAGSAATKAAIKSAVAHVDAQIERVKASDLGKSEQKAAIAHLKTVKANIKTPLPAAPSA
jgi:hypothetical protein